MRKKSLPVTLMALGIAIFCGGLIWFRSTPASTPTEQVAAAQSTPDQTQPAPDSVAPVAPPVPAKAKPAPSSGPSFQQDNRGSTGTNLQGQFNAPITVNPPYDPSVPVVTYDFNGAKRIKSPGRSEVSGREELTSFQNMTKMADAGQCQALLAESQRAVANSDGKWTGARAFNGIALVRVGKKDEGYAALAEVRTRLEALGGGSSDNRAFATALERAGTPALVYAIAGMEHVAVTRGLNLPGAPETFDPSAALWTSA